MPARAPRRPCATPARERSARDLPASRQLTLFDDAAPRAAVPPGPASGGSNAPGTFAHPGADREIVLGEHRVAYALRRARRRSIGFVVGADGLSVSAPRWVGVAEIEAALRAKSAWILRKLHEQHERARHLAAARVDWRDGAVLPFLGRRIVLQAAAAGAPTGLDAERGVLLLALPPGAGATQWREAAQGWLQRQARRVFDERVALYAPRLAVQVRRVSLSSATTRWGSASADGSIRLNWRLVHFALPVLDYVVVHELSHLREMHHGPAFWQVVASVVPDHARWRGALREAVLPVL